MMDSVEKNNGTHMVYGQVTPQLYKKRWFMLLISFIIIPLGTLQWTQFTIIANVISSYYNVSFEAVNWSCLITLLNSVVFVFPCSYVLDKYGIRNGVLFGMFGTTLGAWIKVASASPDRFWLIILGQCVMSIPQISLLGVTPKLAANWFGPNEVAVANSIGIIAIQLGIALGFLLPPILIKQETVERDLFTTGLGLAVLCTLGFIIVVIFFVDKPPIPPSHAALQKDNDIKYLQTLKKIMKNITFLLIAVEVGCNGAIFISIQTILNQLILRHYPGAEEEAGQIGLLMMILSTVGCFLSGVALSKFKAYRLCYLISILFITITLLTLTFTLEVSIVFPYIACSLFGFAYGCLWNISYELTVEVTYPEPEAITIGVVNAVGQAMAIGFTYIYSFLFNKIGDVSANSFFWILSLVSLLMALCTKFEFKREAANIKGASENIPLEVRSKR